jgi:hypothetical protein
VSAAITTIRLPHVLDNNASCYEPQPAAWALVAVKVFT